jgi:hypothetical protein
VEFNPIICGPCCDGCCDSLGCSWPEVCTCDREHNEESEPVMSKPNKRRLKLAELRVQATEAIGMDPGLELELDDGSTITIVSPLLLADDVQEVVDKAEGAVATAKAILGEDEHARFIAAGGHSNDVMLAWKLLSEDLEKDPKAEK